MLFCDSVKKQSPERKRLGSIPFQGALLGKVAVWVLLSFGVFSFAIVVLEHSAMHTVLDAQYLEEFLCRDYFAYLLVVDGIQACHLGILLGNHHQTFFVGLFVARYWDSVLELVDSNVKLSLPVFVFVIDREKGFGFFLGETGFLGDEFLHALAELLLVETFNAVGKSYVPLVLCKCRRGDECK